MGNLFVIQLNNHQLTISGERQEVKEEKGEAYHRLERQIGCRRVKKGFFLSLAAVFFF